MQRCFLSIYTDPCDSTLAAITLGASGVPSPLSKGRVQNLLSMVTLATQHSQHTASQVVLTSSIQRSRLVLSSMFKSSVKTARGEHQEARFEPLLDHW